MNLKNSVFILSFLGGIIAVSSAMFGMVELLKAEGFSSVFEAVSLGGGLKVSIALYATMAGFTISFSAICIHLLRRNNTRGAGISGIVAAAFGFLTVLVPLAFELRVPQLGVIGVVLGSVLAGAGGLVSLRITPSDEAPRRLMTPLQLSFTALFSAMTAVLTGLTGTIFPSPTGGYTHIGDSAIYLVALLLGPVVGASTGVIGPMVADLYVGYPRWFVTVLAHGVQGLIAGFGRGRHVGLQAFFCALGGVFMSFTYFYVNVFIKGYPIAVISLFRDLFGQTAISLIIGMLLIKPLERVTRSLKT